MPWTSWLARRQSKRHGKRGYGSGGFRGGNQDQILGGKCGSENRSRAPDRRPDFLSSLRIRKSKWQYQRRTAKAYGKDVVSYHLPERVKLATSAVSLATVTLFPHVFGSLKMGRPTRCWVNTSTEFSCRTMVHPSCQATNSYSSGGTSVSSKFPFGL